MKLYRNLTLVFATCLLLLISGSSLLRAQATSSRVTIKITDVHNATGKVEIGLWASKEGFPKDGEKTFRKIRVAIVNGTASTTFDGVPFGTYAIAVYHDENNNGKMDSRWPGIPTEGTGVSNNVKSRFSAPSFNECKFSVNEPTRAIQIKMLY